jgi:cytoskeletal protein RodZ
MEGLGKKLREARMARKLTLDEAGRLTRIRPGRLEEIEAEDFSQFASLAYARGFLLIYGKFLDVDVTPYLEAFESSEGVTVDGYSYLQDNPAPKPSRPAVVRKTSGNRGSLLPLVIGIIVLVVGFTVMKLILDIQRIKPAVPRPAPLAQTSPTAAAPAPEKIIAPHALPVENNTAATIPVPTTPPTNVAAAAAAPQPTVAVSTPASSPAAAEPEVRRAEPVHPEDLMKARAVNSAAASEASAPNRLEIRALKKTYIKVVVDNDDAQPAIERWMAPSDKPVQVRGKRISVKVLDSDAVEIRKNGKKISNGDADVTIE